MIGKMRIYNAKPTPFEKFFTSLITLYSFGFTASFAYDCKVCSIMLLPNITKSKDHSIVSSVHMIHM